MPSFAFAKSSFELPAGPKADLVAKVGDISDIELFNNEVLVAVYIREKSKGGIIYANSTKTEDRYQSKVGLVIAKGPNAFRPSDGWFEGSDAIVLYEWVLFRPADGMEMALRGPDGDVTVRLMVDTAVRGRLGDNPEKIF